MWCLHVVETGYMFFQSFKHVSCALHFLYWSFEDRYSYFQLLHQQAGFKMSETTNYFSRHCHGFLMPQLLTLNIQGQYIHEFVLMSYENKIVIIVLNNQCLCIPAYLLSYPYSFMSNFKIITIRKTLMDHMHNRKHIVLL